MESTPLREAVLKTHLDLTLSGIKYNKFRNFTFDPNTIPLSSTTIPPSNLVVKPRTVQPKKLPAVPLKYGHSLEYLPSKTPLPPKKSCSPLLDHSARASTLERQRTSITNSLRKSGSLSALPTAKIEDRQAFLDNYSVGQPELKLPRTPRNVTPTRTQFADPYTKYSALGLGRAQSTFKTQRAAMTTYQSSPKGSITPVTARRNGVLSVEEQRYRVVREIFQTEDTYVQNLRTLTSSIYRPLLKAKLVTPLELKRLLPPQLNDLLACHTDLLDKLRDRVSNSKWHDIIGDIFCNLCPGSRGMYFFQMYSDYVIAFPSALSVYEKHMRNNEEFRGFIRACMESPSCRGLDLCAFLLTPIQRLPRYLLLLTELTKYTCSSHPDSYFANMAAEKFRACLILLNDSIHHVLDIASKSSAWQNEPRTKSATRASKTSRKVKKASKRVCGISRTVSNSDLKSSSTLCVESCPPSFFTNTCSLVVQSPPSNEKWNKSAKRVLKLDPPPQPIPSLVSDDKMPFSPPPLTSNKSHTDSGIYEEDPDLPQDETPAFKPHTPIPEATGFLVPSLDATATRHTSGEDGHVHLNNIHDILDTTQRITEIGILNEPESSTGPKDKRHFRRRSADRILRLFKIFKSK